MFCLRASQIWSDLICGRRLQMLWSDIYLNHVCAKVYQIRVPSIKSIIGDRVMETSRKASLLGMTGCPLLPSPSPFHFSFSSRSNFRAITRLETLATQANSDLPIKVFSPI